MTRFELHPLTTFASDEADGRMMLSTVMGEFSVADASGTIGDYLTALIGSEVAGQVGSAGDLERKLGITALARLVKVKAITRSSPAHPARDPILRWLTASGFSRPKGRKVSIVGNHVVSSRLGENLTNAGVELAEAWDDAVDLVVCLSCGWSADECMAANDVALKRNVAALFVQVDRDRIAVGPLVIPRETACFRCLTSQTHWSSREVDGPESALVGELAATLAAAEAIRYLGGSPVPLDSATLTIHNILDGSRVQLRLMRSPRCASCGTHSAAGTADPSLSDDNSPDRRQT